MMRFLALLAALALLPAPAFADPGANQLVSWSQICAEVSNGRFLWSASAPAQCASVPNLIIAWSDFTSSVKSSGCGSGNPLPTYQQFINCRVLIGQVSSSVSGTATGYQPAISCGKNLVDCNPTPSSPAVPLDTSTSTTTVNPTSANAISWSVTASAASSVGTCTVALLKGTTTVAGPTTMTTGVASTGTYTGGAGSGAYILRISSATNNGICVVSGSLSWWQ